MPLFAQAEPPNISAFRKTAPIRNMRPGRLTKEEALSFLLTHIVVEKSCNFELNQTNLFIIMNMAAEAEARVNREDGAIPHEVIETIARNFLEKQDA